MNVGEGSASGCGCGSASASGCGNGRGSANVCGREREGRRGREEGRVTVCTSRWKGGEEEEGGGVSVSHYARSAVCLPSLRLSTKLMHTAPSCVRFVVPCNFVTRLNYATLFYFQSHIPPLASCSPGKISSELQKGPRVR